MINIIIYFKFSLIAFPSLGKNKACIITGSRYV
jgi:hypothetical protein